MTNRETQRAQAAELTGKIADHLNASGPPTAINWLAILELLTKLLPIILAFLAEDTNNN